MLKNARIEKGRTFIDTYEIQPDGILGAGGDSSGYALLTGDKLLYLPERSPDLKETLNLLAEALEIISTGILQANLGGDITTPDFQVQIAEIKTKVDELKERLM